MRRSDEGGAGRGFFGRRTNSENIIPRRTGRNGARKSHDARFVFARHHGRVALLGRVVPVGVRPSDDRGCAEREELGLARGRARDAADERRRGRGGRDAVRGAAGAEPVEGQVGARAREDVGRDPGFLRRLDRAAGGPRRGERPRLARRPVRAREARVRRHPPEPRLREEGRRRVPAVRVRKPPPPRDRERARVPALRDAQRRARGLGRVLVVQRRGAPPRRRRREASDENDARSSRVGRRNRARRRVGRNRRRRLADGRRALPRLRAGLRRLLERRVSDPPRGDA